MVTAGERELDDEIFGYVIFRGKRLPRPERPLKPCGLGPMPRIEDLYELGAEVERRYLGELMVDDDGPRPLRNLEMHALIHWRQWRRQDLNFVPQLAAVWGMIGRQNEHRTDNAG